jgi:hypothetical protein
MNEYVLDIITTLAGLENAGAYWRVKCFEKIGFSLALKLGLI